MNITATLFAQAAVFALFIAFTVKFIWPYMLRAIETRQKTIADGLAAAEQGKRSLEESTKQADASIAQARNRAAQVIDEARNAAKEEGGREMAAAKAEIAQEVTRAREQLRDQVASLAVAGAAKILRREIDAKAHAELLDSIKKQL